MGVEFAGGADARASPKVIESIMNSKLVVICPSNPIVSIGTILSIAEIRDALKKTDAAIVGISPIVAGAPIKGPADKLLRGLGLEVSAFSVAKLYSDFLGSFVIDNLDVNEKNKIEGLGIRVKTTNTIMKSFEDKVRLAQAVLQK